MQEKQSGQSSVAPATDGDKEGGARRRPTLSVRDVLLRLLGLGLIDAVALWFIYRLIADGLLPAAVVLAVVTLVVNWVFLDDRLYPVRWLTPGLLLMLLMVVYPLVFAVYIAFTNYSAGNILTKEQVIRQLESQYYQPPNAVSYEWTAYRNPSGDFKIIFKDPQGRYYLGDPQKGLEPFEVQGDQPPATIDGYQRVERLQTFQYLGQLTKIEIKEGENLIRITGVGRAVQSRQQYTYHPESDTLVDNQTGKVYRPVRGNFTADDGTQLYPGWPAFVGFENYLRVINDPNIRGPFFTVFIWTVVFAALSVLLTFVVGLGLALVLNDRDLPLRPIFRSIMIIPYTIPGVISVLIWTGLLNPYYGNFSLFLKSVFGSPPGWFEWFSDGTWAKMGILLVNTWLGFPYMMLLCLGALQSIPTDMYEAADIDGAGPWTKFYRLTLPLLLVSVAPLLIGSFAYNFNNFGVIELYNRGGPPISGANTPAGQTDILISYAYRLAFGGGQGADYGLASAISVFIFLIVAGITLFNFRYTRTLEELT
jgi:ABC-type sugar transport system permease subunit